MLGRIKDLFLTANASPGIKYSVGGDLIVTEKPFFIISLGQGKEGWWIDSEPELVWNPKLDRSEEQHSNSMQEVRLRAKDLNEAQD